MFILTDVLTRYSVNYRHHCDGSLWLLWSVCMDINVCRLCLLNAQVCDIAYPYSYEAI